MKNQTKNKLILLSVLCLLGIGLTLLGKEGLKLRSAIRLVPATYDQKDIIHNLSRFYAYDMSKPCGNEPGWAFPANGLYRAHNIDAYWKDSNRHPLIIEINGELGGFVLLHKVGSTPDVNWNIAEFFIAGNFQRKGLGAQVATELFKRFPGKIEIMILPCNTPALSFWKKVVKDYTKGQFTESRKEIPTRNPKDTIILQFKS